MKKKCSNCGRKQRKLCDFKHRLQLDIKLEIKEKGRCSTWVPENSSCLNCKRLKECILKGRSVTEEKVCSLYRLKKKQVPTNIEQVVDKVLLEKRDEATDKGGKSKDVFSPVNLVEGIIQSNFDPGVFDLIDERDIPKADNEIKFIMDPDFMGIDLYARQMVAALNFFSAYCPYCSDTRFINKKVKVGTKVDEIMDRTMLYKNGVCPRCKKDKYQAVRAGDLKFYNQLIGVAGQRSGKSALTAILSATIAHKYLSLSNPTTYFGLLPNTTFHGTFVSLSYQQAFDLLWDPFIKVILGSPWFKMYISFLESEGERIGRELVKVRDSFIIFQNKGLTFYPSGPDKRKLRGKTRILSSIDEIGWFFAKAQDAVKLDPDEIYEALDNSLMTVKSKARKLLPIQPDTPTAYGIYISSPSSQTDKSMRLLNTSKTSDSIYGFHYPTWRFNPNISKRDLADKFAENPVKAERDFGANPPHALDPFITGASGIIPTFSKKRNVLKISKYKVVKDSLGGKLLSPIVDFKASHTYPSVLSIDAGYNNNSFACTLLHPVWDEDFETITNIRCSGVVEIIPKPYALSFPHIYENVIVPILEEFNVKMVLVDRWQSINLRQQIYKEHDIEAIQYSVKYKDFEEVRTRILSNEYMFPKLEHEIDTLLNIQRGVDELVERSPVTHLFLQLLMSRDTGRTVTKGDDITDDILRALTLGTHALLNEDYEDLFKEGGDETGKYYKNLTDIAKLVTATNAQGSSGGDSSGTSQSIGVFMGGSNGMGLGG